MIIRKTPCRTEELIIRNGYTSKRIYMKDEDILNLSKKDIEKIERVKRSRRETKKCRSRKTKS